MAPAKDTTLTETAFEPPGRSARTAVHGILVVFSEHAVALAPSAVAAPRTIGRDDSADIIVDDPSVSRTHARFTPTSGGLDVEDLGSHNGTFVGGVRIAAATRAAFGSVVRFGSTIVVVVADVGAFASDGPPAVGLVGGPSLEEVRRRIATIAKSSSTVLVEGETGTGKEVVARAIHDASGRSGELVGLNCAAIASELVESELFGHARGAFSGSQGSRGGLFRAADRGTLLLDEISEVPPAVQAKLLRVLETGEVRSVGEDRDVRVDVRVVAATNRSLFSLVDSGAFRADLMHRVAALRIRVPSLRERLEDVPRLCEHFLRDEGIAIAAIAVDALMRHDWPGNVRELRNVVHAAAATARYAKRDRIVLEDIELARPSRPPPGAADADDDQARARIDAALGACDGNVTRAATQLGMSRSILYETIRRLRIDASAHRKR